MSGRFPNSNLWFPVCAALALAAAGCGKKADPVMETTTAAPAPTGPDYQVFAPLEEAMRARAMPFLISEGGGIEENTCFQIVEGLEPSSAGMAERAPIEDSGDKVARALAAWMVSELQPLGLTEVEAARWEVDVEDPVVLEVSKERLRFVEDPECISDQTGWLSEGTRAVSALIGAKRFVFKTAVPVGKQVKEEMLRVTADKGIKMESEALFQYKPARDKKDELIANEQGVPMYVAPDGTHIPETQVPPESQQVMREWTMEFEQPLYFAFRELPEDAWRREAQRDKCDVNLIWQDVTPRRPDCEEFNESSFSVVKTEKGEVSVTITTGDDNKGAILEPKEAKRVQVSDRIILWLSPVEIEEGALVRINSLVLDPKPMATQAKDQKAPTNSSTGKTDLDNYLRN